ncbi:MAG: peptidase S9 prolyl oligopeptidase active site domain-containing protein [Acidimicrobiaceae bacterium]|nr:MAG: peptidase S9 prolyl oligopeptidase active site domain-containing protein [Acidimicrobiaceae bacterium]
MRLPWGVVSTNEMPYGRWPSPVTPELLTEGAVGLVDVWVGEWEGVSTTVWLESRPREAGRLQLVVLGGDGGHHDLLPEGFSARSGVHEYGGGAAWVEGDVAWFVNWADQRLYRLTAGEAPVPLTPEPSERRALRYADMRLSPDRRWIVCVRESHAGDVTNEIVALRSDEPSEPVVLFAGTDFVAQPRFVGDGRLRWISWNHPNMPWNDTSLHEGRFDGETGVVDATVRLASGQSFMQPVGDMVISDRSNWWNLWRFSGDDRQPAFPQDAEMSGPAWAFGERDYVLAADGRMAWAVGGTVMVDGVGIPTAAAGFDHWTIVGSTVTAIARFSDRDASIVRFDLDDPSELRTVVPGRVLPLSDADISKAEPISFPTVTGTPAHAWYYPPANAAVHGPAQQRPPLVVMIHGGPTAHAVPFFSLAKQFWTSRGFAVVDVNHRGSTGFGREFRNLLDGQWGIVDVEDCCAAARWLAESGRVDPDRMVIRGGSAGGFTVLASLAAADVFAAGASSYGIADLAALTGDTHKFEAHYCDRLIGPWPEAHRVPGPRRHGGGAQPERDDRRCTARQGCRVRVPRVRGRGPRVPQGGNDRRLAHRRARVLSAGAAALAPGASSRL